MEDEPHTTTLINSSTIPAHYQPLACAVEFSLLKNLPIPLRFPLSCSLPRPTPELKTAGGDLCNRHEAEAGV